MASCYQQGKTVFEENKLRLNIPWTVHRPDRSLTDFHESSFPTKRHKTKALKKQIPYDQLTYAAQMSRRAAGLSEVSRVMKVFLLRQQKRKNIEKSVISTLMGIYNK